MYGWGCGLRLRQTLKNIFERSNPTYINALTIITEKTLEYYRQAFKEASKTLAEAVSELWKERIDVIKQLEQKNSTEEPHHSQERGNALPADQFKMESFSQIPSADSTTSTHTKSRSHNIAKQFKRLTRPKIRPKHSTINTTSYKKTPPRQRRMKHYMKVTPPTGGAPGVLRTLQEEEEGSARSKRKDSSSNSNNRKNSIIYF